jgi:hypothetical protein
MIKWILLALWVALFIAGTGMAHADETSFLSDMDAAGFHNDNGNSAELSVGLRICSEVASGESGLAAARDLWLNSQIASEDEAAQFVMIAVKNLCPIYWHPHQSGLTV